MVFFLWALMIAKNIPDIYLTLFTTFPLWVGVSYYVRLESPWAGTKTAHTAWKSQKRSVLATVKDNLYLFQFPALGTGTKYVFYSCLVLKLPRIDIWLIKVPEDPAVNQNTFSLVTFKKSDLVLVILFTAQPYKHFQQHNSRDSKQHGTSMSSQWEGKKTKYFQPLMLPLGNSLELLLITFYSCFLPASYYNFLANLKKMCWGGIAVPDKWPATRWFLGFLGL